MSKFTEELTEINNVLDLVKQVRELLQQIEYSHYSQDGNFCPICGHFDGVGHYFRCKLAQAIEILGGEVKYNDVRYE